MSDSYQGKVCVVTGGGEGIGKAVVTALLAEGAKVYALDLHPERLKDLENGARGAGSLTALEVDVIDREGMAAVADRIHAEAGEVDLLINNAGVTHLDETIDMTFEKWRRVLDVNFLGTLHGVFHFYPAMVKRGAGHIVNVASIAGVSGYATAQAYAASKGAVIGFTRSLQVEAKMHGVTVTDVSPSYVETQIFDDALCDGWDKEKIEQTFMTPPLSAERAAASILAGVRKRKKTVVFPFSGRFLHWMSRWCPFVLGGIQKMLLKKYRAVRPG